MRPCSLFGTRRVGASALSALAALAFLGLTRQAQADMGCPTLGVITAKTFVDPANHITPALGDGKADDTATLQDMINYALNRDIKSHVEAIQLEPGTYRITKTLIAQVLGNPYGQYFGLSISGLTGPDRGGWNQLGGVAIVLDAAATDQPAVLEIGQGGFYDSTLQNIALQSSVPNSITKIGTKYGLFFAEQEFSHFIVRNVTVSNVGTAFAIISGPTGGGNGEMVDIDECAAMNVNCFYWNNCGQALVHKINNCEFGINNGGVCLKIGNLVAVPPKNFVLGYDLDVSTLCGTFTYGPLQNTFLENDGISGCVNVKGGRVEWADTVLSYAGGAYSCAGSVEMRGIDFGSANAYPPNPPKTLKSFPLVDASLHGTDLSGNEQYTNTFSDCLFNGTYGPVFPALSLTSVPGDLSKNYFDRCRFTGYSNKLTDLPNLSALGGVVSQCRAATGSNALFTPIP